MTKVIKGKYTFYKEPADIFEAFGDILAAMGKGDFENIRTNASEGFIEYDVYGKHIKRVFDLTMNPDELAADVMQWCFSMLDGIANL